MPVKTKGIQNILEPIQVQVNKLRALTTKNVAVTNDAFPSKSILIEQLESLKDSFDQLSGEDAKDYQDLKSKITKKIEKFCCLEYNTDSNPNPGEQDLNSIITAVFDNFLSALTRLETLECLPLRQTLLDCWEYIKDMGAANEIEHFQNIKELGTSILDLLEPLQRYKKNLTSQLLSNRITLYCGQMCTAFKLLVQLVEEQHRLNAPIYNCKKYVCDRLCLCIKMIVDILDAPQPSEEEENNEVENHFVYRMDLALDIIAEMSNKSHKEQAQDCEELWLRIEDVFSHAMAIAQVCSPQNFKAITGTCQSIMAEYENLKLQLTSQSPDTALNNLFMNTLNDALYRLERKINISVLSLVLEVFSDPFTALRKLVMFCGNSLNAKIRSESDLTSAIEDFDQILDKCMQIGLFAIASCSDANRINRIRNCLAGLESLETELVSSVVAFYLRPDSKEMRANVKLLTTQWQAEMNKLHDAVDLIMDSAAFCEVVLEDIQERVTIMSNCLDNREPVTQSQVKGVVQKAQCLSRQISAVMNDIGTDIIERQTIMMVRELKAAIFEADVAAKTLLVENPTEPQQLRVIKRCELILNVVKRLQPALVLIINSTVSVSPSLTKSLKGQGDYAHDTFVKSSCSIYQTPCNGQSLSYIRTPYTVRHYKSPLSIQPANSIPRLQSDISCLLPYIQKGREMRSERSVMYKTPRREEKKMELTEFPSEEKKLHMRKLSSIRQHLFSRDSTEYFEDASFSDESMDLTGVLEKFVSSCSTLNSVPSTTIHNKSLSDKSKIVARTLANIPESLIRSISAQSGLFSRSKIEECSSIGGGDGPLVVEKSK